MLETILNIFPKQVKKDEFDKIAKTDIDTQTYTLPTADIFGIMTGNYAYVTYERHVGYTENRRKIYYETSYVPVAEFAKQ